MKIRSSVLKRKKAEATSQMFTYVMGAIIVGVILIFGSGAVMKMLKSGEDIGDKMFERELIGFFDNMISQNYGSERMDDFSILKDFDSICFVSEDKFGKSINTGHPEVDVAVSTGSADNVFLISEKNVHAFQVVNISRSNKLDTDGFYCHDIKSSRIKLTLQSQGDSVALFQIT